MNRRKRFRELRYQPLKEDKYSIKTLEGNWFENRSESVLENYKLETTYNAEYIPKETEHCEVNKGKSGVDPIIHSRVGHLEYPNFFENYTTTSDLSYNHFPKWFKDDSPIKRNYNAALNLHLPTEEYLEPFHNLTNYGLTDYKKNVWMKSSSKCPVKLEDSVYKKAYLPPHVDCYEFPRWSKPKAISSLLNKNIEISEILKLRGFITDFSNPIPPDQVLFKRKELCNPLTWECPPEQKVCIPKHQWKNCLYRNDVEE